MGPGLAVGGVSLIARHAGPMVGFAPVRETGRPAVRLRAAEPLTGPASILSGRLQSIPARNPHVCWPAPLTLRPAMIPDRDG